MRIFGKMRVNSNADPSAKAKFDWTDAFIDAIITAGVSACSAYVGVASCGLSDVLVIRAVVFAAVTAFCSYIALKRGLIKREVK
jgi:hypothetical protein